MHPPLPDRYEALQELGDGGMGVVYRARDRVLGRQVAIKLLKSDSPALAQRMLREARAIAALDHPNVVKLHDILEEPPGLVMEFVEGLTLDHAWRNRTLRDRLALLHDAARAVAAAHARRIVHRDLKPANIMVAGARVVLMDFGLAHTDAATLQLTQAGAVLGTPLYMAPEQALGLPVDPATDVWALGVILYEMLAGTTPFRGSTMPELFSDIAAADAPPLPASVPRDLQTICRKAIEKDSASRYPTAAEFADDLARHLAGEPIRARPPSPLRRIRRFARVHRAALLLLVAAATGTLAFALWRSAETRARDASRRLDDAQLYHPLERELDRLRLGHYRSGFRLTEAALEKYDAFVGRIEAQMAATGQGAQGHYLIGRCRELTAAFEAERAYARALELEPGHAATLLALGRLRIERALVERAMHGADEDRVRRAIETARAGQDLVTRAAGAEGFESELAHAYVFLIADWGKPRSFPGAEKVARWPDEPLAEEFLLVEGLAAADARTLVRCTNDMIARTPASPKGHLWRAVARKDLNELDAAVADFTRAIELNPRYVLALNGRGIVQVRMRDLDGAIDDYTRALALDPHFVEARHNRAIARDEKGDHVGAIEDSTRVLELSPGHAMAYLNRAKARRATGDFAGAIDDASRAIERRPHAAAYSARGIALQASGRLDDAIADYTQALTLDPGDAIVCYNLGTALVEKGDFEGAIGSLSRAIEIDSKLGNAFFNRGRAHSRRRDFEKAIEDYSRAIELMPQHADAYTARGQAREARRERAAALADYAKALEVAPPDWPHRAALAEYVRKAGGR